MKSWVWWHTSEIPALVWWKQYDFKSKATLGYRIRQCLQNEKQIKETNKKGPILRASRDAETVYKADTTFKMLIYLLANKIIP